MRNGRPIQTGLALGVHTALRRGPPCKKRLSLTIDPKKPPGAAVPLSNRIYSLMLRQ